MPRLIIDQYTNVDSVVNVSNEFMNQQYDLDKINNISAVDVGPISGVLVQPAEGESNNTVERYKADGFLAGMFIQTRDFAGAKFTETMGLAAAGGGNIPGGGQIHVPGADSPSSDLPGLIVREGMEYGSIIYLKATRLETDLYAIVDEDGSAPLVYAVGDSIYASPKYGVVTKDSVGDAIGVVMAVKNNFINILFV